MWFRRFGEMIVRATYVAFFVLIVFAAADYGLTRAESLPRFQVLMGGTVIVWLIGCVCSGRLPRTGWFVWVPVVVLLGGAWVRIGSGIFFAQALENLDPIAIEILVSPDGWLAALSQWESGFETASGSALGTTTVLLGGFLMTVEIWRDEAWSRLLLWTMILTGFSITVLFLLQVTIGPPFQLMNLGGKPTRFFVFNYHGSGASFVNLFWPVALAITGYCLATRSRWAAVWIMIPVAMFVALFLNVSKAGNVLAVVGLIVFAIFAAKSIWRMLSAFKIRLRRTHALAVVLPIVVIGISCYYAIPWERWDYYTRDPISVENDTRMRAFREFVKMIPDAGITGMGVGAFEHRHLEYLKHDPKLSRVPFWVAHQDYIQTAVEWGSFGTALWGLILLPGAFGVARGMFSNRLPQRPPRQNFYWGRWDVFRQWFLGLPDVRQPLLLAGVATAMLLTAIHAAFDFPMQIPSLGLYFLIWTALGWSQFFALRTEHDDEWDD